MSREIGIVLFLFKNFYFLCHVFRIWVTIKISIWCFAKPVVTCFKLVWEVFVIVFLWSFVVELFAVRWFASQREVSSGMFVCWFNVLVVSLVTWELSSIWAQLRAWSITVQQIFRMRSLDIISFISFESISISRA